MVDWKKIALFAGGTLFGTAGVKILASDDAKKVYTQCTAAVLRAKDCVMKTVTTVQENAGDIYEDAKTINEERAAAKEAAVVEDAEKAEEAVEEASSAFSASSTRSFRASRSIRGGFVKRLSHRKRVAASSLSKRKQIDICGLVSTDRITGRM